MLAIDFFKSAEGKFPVAEYLYEFIANKLADSLWTLSAIRLTHPAPSVYLKKMVAPGDLWKVRV